MTSSVIRAVFLAVCLALCVVADEFDYASSTSSYESSASPLFPSDSEESDSSDGWPKNWVLAVAAIGFVLVLTAVIVLIAALCSRGTNDKPSQNAVIEDEM